MPNKKELMEWVNSLPDEGQQEINEGIEGDQQEDQGQELAFDDLPEDVQEYISQLREENESFKSKKRSANGDAKKLRLKLKEERAARQKLEAIIQGQQDQDDDFEEDDDQNDQNQSSGTETGGLEFRKLQKRMDRLEKENKRLSKAAQESQNKAVVAEAEKALLESGVQKKYLKFVKRDLLDNMNDELFDLEDFIDELQEENPEFFKTAESQPASRKRGSTSSDSKKGSGKKPKKDGSIKKVASRSNSHAERVEHKKWLKDTFGVGSKPNIRIK